MLLINGCSTYSISPDIFNDCDHPAKPVELTDRSVALFILEQSETIDICRALLGKELT